LKLGSSVRSCRRALATKRCLIQQGREIELQSTITFLKTKSFPTKIYKIVILIAMHLS